MLSRFEAFVAFFLAGEEAALLEEALSYLVSLCDEWRDAADGSKPSDRANGEIACYFLRSLARLEVEDQLRLYVALKHQWLEELREIPPRSVDADAVWRRMVLAALESQNFEEAKELFNRRRSYLGEKQQFLVLQKFFNAKDENEEKVAEVSERWAGYLADARRRAAGSGRPNPIQIHELMLVASLKISGLHGNGPKDHWRALRVIRGSEELEA